MSRDLWKLGVPWRDTRPDGNIRHSQLVSTFGPGALADLVDEAVVIAGLGWWAKGPPIVEDRLVAMLAREPDFRNVKLHWPPTAEGKDLDDPNRKWIKGFVFPEWFVCRNEKCWEESEEPPRRDGARPRRLIHVSRLVDHKCKIARGKKKFQPIRFTRACRLGHVDDIEWATLVHRRKDFDCKRVILWVDEAGASGDLADVRVTCSGCGANIRMAVAAQRFTEQEPTLGWCAGRRAWLGEERGGGCSEPMRLLLRSASHAYFPVTASVIHIPDPDAAIREKVAKVYDTIKEAEDAAEVKFFRKKVAAVRVELEGISDDAAYAEVARVREGKPIAHKKVKEAEIEVFLNLPEELRADRPGGRFFARTIALPKKRPAPMDAVDRVVLVQRLTEVRALVGFTRFESKTADVDGELDIGAEVARPDEQPLTWLPAVENLGEGFFFSLDEERVLEWEKRRAVRDREELFKKGFALWQKQRPDRANARADFANARFVLLHSLAHLLITAISLDCGYSASSIRERTYSGAGGSGILLYTASSGADGSLGGIVEVGRRLERYLEDALDLGRLCSNDPVCAAHVPAYEVGTTDRYLEGASCHGCLLISEASCERMNVYLDRTLVVPTVEMVDAAFFPRP